MSFPVCFISVLLIFLPCTLLGGEKDPCAKPGEQTSGQLVKRVQPGYPAEARQKHVEGIVKALVTVAKDGSVREVEIVEGDPLLVDAAKQAIMQWQYTPFMNCGQAVEMRSMEHVKFALPVPQPTSDVAVPLNNQAIHIIAPAGGERWASGSVHTISWDASNLNRSALKIGYRYVTTGKTVYFATVRGNVGSYRWTVGDKNGPLPPGDYQIIISGLGSRRCTSSIPGHCREGPSGTSNTFTVIAPSASR